MEDDILAASFLKRKPKLPAQPQRQPVAVVETDPMQGLSAQQAQQRLDAGWGNLPVASPGDSVKQILAKNIFTYFNFIFFFLAICVIAVRQWLNLTFLGPVFCNMFIGILQDLRAKKKIDNLKIMSAPKCTAVRDGQELALDSAALVRDDVVIFGAGDQICADAVVLCGECRVNEALVTGEADEIIRNPGEQLLSGSFVVSGSCRARLTAVGADSFASRLTIEAKQTGSKPQSEMMRSLTNLIKWIGFIVIPLGAIMFIKEYLWLGNTAARAVTSTVGSIVGMIPEGLYLLTSLALVASVIRLANRRTLVQDMGCIETLARVDTLCVDKTGTITEAGMEVDGVQCLQPERYIESDIRLIMTDYAAAMQKDNETMAAIKRYFSGEVRQTALAAMPFSSAKKYGGVSFHEDETYLLGAPDILLAHCPEKEQYLSAVQAHAAKGCRVLLLALYDGNLSDEAPTAGLLPLALILLSNRIRPEAPETFSYFAAQGVKTKVISGDNPLTVAEVARRAGIPDADQYVDARTLKTDEQLARAAEEKTIFGRVTPDQKKKLVRAMKAAGHTVAMTGDGVNDVLALREADCSIAMASGSGVACQASHIVLLDSQFSAMPSVVAEGRRVINNIERSAALYLVKNIFTFVLAVITLIFTLPYPYTPAQLSLVNALTIGIPSFVLAMEPNENRISGKFMRNVVFRALPAALSDIILVVGVMLFYLAFHISDTMLSTICTGIMGIVGLMMVCQTSRPFNTLRKIMMVGLCAAFGYCYFFLPQLFTLSKLDKPSLLILVVLGLLAFSVMFACRKAFRQIQTRLAHGIFPPKKK